MVANILINCMTELFKIVLKYWTAAPGLEPGIFWSVVRYLIHWATRSFRFLEIFYRIAEGNFGAGVVGKCSDWAPFLTDLELSSYDNFLEENIPNQQISASATVKRTKCQDEVHVQNQVEPEEIKLFQIKIKNPWFSDISWRMITLFFKT